MWPGVSLFPFYFIMVEGSCGLGGGKRAGQLSSLGCLCPPAPESWLHATVFSGLSQTFTLRGIPALPYGLGLIDSGTCDSGWKA